MEYMAMAGALTKVSAALGFQHMAWHMHPDRLGQLLADADATGFLDFSVAGTVEAASRALLRAADRMAPADRLLDVTDISAAANINMGGSWYEQLRVNMLVRDNSLHPLAQFCAVISEGYTLLERGDPAGFFRDLVDTLLETAAPGIAAATTNRAKTAKVVAFWLQTQPEREGFLKFTSPDTAFDELTRRGATTAALRFAPSFDKFWRSEFKELDRLLKHPTDGRTARSQQLRRCARGSSHTSARSTQWHYATRLTTTALGPSVTFSSTSRPGHMHPQRAGWPHWTQSPLAGWITTRTLGHSRRSSRGYQQGPP